MEAVSPIIVAPCGNMDQVMDEMGRRLERLQHRKDRRIVFHRVYLLMTREMKRRLNGGYFHDAQWMERVLVRFAKYYFAAMDDRDAGRPCAPAWELAFRQARSESSFVLQDALLGINAHINNDLAMVLHGILLEDQAWPDARMMFERRKDHDQINEVLGELVDQVQDELGRHYARFIRPIDRILGRQDEKLSGCILAHCRTMVWLYTEQLLNAENDRERESIRHRIEREAFGLGRQVVDVPAFRMLRVFAPITRRFRWF
ncbi:DUF5995 family protein [Paenibacillus montanisoli]|uniref:Uncharacterized protein n=1 Tax=Paenibacillus montanisoli TaxID=2081970 RepID=A0A328TS52_9BACL|nr:DUF5995 family protein [Paenibacillus montanisoli]RAP73427.1 hypothetical protein DL346_27375 [Paenibacillus montanisoli]